MKKFIGILLVTLVVGATIPAQAQIKLGVKGGLNLASSLSDTWSDVRNTDNYTGFFIGPMVDVTIPIVGLGVDGALMYSQKGNKFNGETLKQQGLELPINLKYSFGLGSLASIYLAAGPSFFFNMRSDDKFNWDGVEGAIRYKNSELALNLGAGVKLLNHLQIGVNYNMPLTDSAKAKIDSGETASGVWGAITGKSYKTKVWQVSVAYIF
ncbi:MAG: porin family protein [Bacteroides sp.]|nr:porin family protein [Bacteroides sp.]